MNAAGNNISLDGNDDVARAYKQQMDNESRELFASFRVFCNRKSVCSNTLCDPSFNNEIKEKSRNTRMENIEEKNEQSNLTMIFLCLQQILCKEVLLDDTDIAKAIIEGISSYSIELLILGAPSRSGLVR